MMISPQGYIAMHENDSFEQLIKERKRLIREINKLEKIVYDENQTDDMWTMSLGPDVQYQMNLMYLAKLCEFMQEKYNREIVWSEKDE